ncbi:MAG: transcriptional regulator [Burkholderiaceae bacterium]|nr:MAG: transcriptional regulator [Burkholderiaceae bacterium]TAM05039.1 MAG: transcriptional regulator [Pusillimonas sp.]
MSYELSVASVASLIGDPARSFMLTALLDGRALPAGELAYAAHVTPQTASTHLAKLRQGNLVTVEVQGRHRYYRLAGPHVAEALERLAVIRQQPAVRYKPLSPKARQLQWARCCYNHLAGCLGVAVTDGLVTKGYIEPADQKQYDITQAGAEWFAAVGLDVCAIEPTHRGVARQCLDWTERRHHLAGPLGTALLRSFCEQRWLSREHDSRAVLITSLGRVEFKRQLGIETEELQYTTLHPQG